MWTSVEQAPPKHLNTRDDGFLHEKNPSRLALNTHETLGHKKGAIFQIRGGDAISTINNNIVTPSSRTAPTDMNALSVLLSCVLSYVR